MSVNKPNKSKLDLNKFHKKIITLKTWVVYMIIWILWMIRNNDKKLQRPYLKTELLSQHTAVKWFNVHILLHAEI